MISTHSRAKAAGLWQAGSDGSITKFQLTAARRRLDDMLGAIKKSADNFNSQPREGGWLLKLLMAIRPKPFQLTAARRRLGRSA